MSVQNIFYTMGEYSTAFSILPAYFPNTEEKIKTFEFLEASKGAVELVDRFGKVFAPVIYDMNKNIDKIYTRYYRNKELFEYVEDMLLEEKQKGELLTIDAMLWLRRGLDFIRRFFQSVIENSEGETVAEDLTPFFKKAYSDSLEQYHGWLGTQLFNVMSRFAPNRESLFFILGLDRHHKEEHVLRDMRNFNQRMTACVEKLTQFYKENNLEVHDRV